MHIEEILDKLDLPDALTDNAGRKITSVTEWESRRKELQDIIQKRIYGYVPDRPLHLDYCVEETDSRFCAGKATKRKILLRATFPHGGVSSFRITSVIPNGYKNIPAFIHINFRSDVPDKYMPTEEITDNGYAVFSFCYEDVTTDDNNMTSGIAKNINRYRRESKRPGKIAIWAWAAMRVMDYVQSIRVIDKNNIAVVGHSRLGKTALLTAALDKRFAYAISNDSGCCGAALERGKCGEKYNSITVTFPYWFTPKFVTETHTENTFPFDQHFLLSLIAPRHILIGSAEEDKWADPRSEYLCLCKVNEIYRLYGKDGLVHPDEIPENDATLDNGDNHYHVRPGLHYFSRTDWLRYMAFMDKYVTKFEKDVRKELGDGEVFVNISEYFDAKFR